MKQRIKTLRYDAVEILAVVFRWAKPLLRPFFRRHWKQKTANISKDFRDNALKALKDFDSALSKNGVSYSLAFGTMLGAVREKGFIKHDLDIDTAVWVDQDSQKIRQVLEQAGFSCIHTFLVADGRLGREETYEKFGVRIDIFYFYPSTSEYPYCCDFLRWPTCRNMYASMRWKGRILARRIEMPMAREYKLVPFEDMQLPIPVNAEQLLRFRYGDDYMIPNTKWSQEGSFDKHIINWPEVKATVQKGTEPWPYGM